MNVKMKKQKLKASHESITILIYIIISEIHYCKGKSQLLCHGHGPNSMAVKNGQSKDTAIK